MKKKNKKDILIRFSEEELKMLDEIYNYLNTEENIRITKSFIVRYGIATLYKKIKNNELEERNHKAIDLLEEARENIDLPWYDRQHLIEKTINELKGADKE